MPPNPLIGAALHLASTPMLGQVMADTTVATTEVLPEETITTIDRLADALILLLKITCATLEADNSLQTMQGEVEVEVRQEKECAVEVHLRIETINHRQ